MAKKSFLEEELAREAKMRARCAEIKHAVIPEQSEKRRKDIEEQLKGPYGIIFTPNEIRAEYGYPTISDEPQSIMIFETGEEQ